MAGQPVVRGRELVQALQRAGFTITGQRGSHVKLRRGEVVVVVPVHGGRDLRTGTVRAILRDTGLTVDELVRLLR